MLVEKKLIKQIKDLGLNSYEAKIWTALLSRGVSTAGEISDIANVPRSRSYDVLESLEKKGFIVMKVGKPIQYISVPPEEVLERVKKNVMEEAEQRVDSLQEFQDSDLLDELKVLHTDGIDSVDPTEIAGYVKSSENISDQMRAMVKKATKTIMISTTESGVKEIENLTKAFSKTGKNVKVMISSPTTVNVPNAEVKNTGLTGKFMIVDSEKVVMSITDDNVHPTYDTSIWVESPSLASSLEQMFTQAWTGKLSTGLKVTVQSKVKN